MVTYYDYVQSCDAFTDQLKIKAFFTLCQVYIKKFSIKNYWSVNSAIYNTNDR